MTYNEFIQNIITTRGQGTISPSTYGEGHHILPKCLGGKGSTRAKHPNIIRLTAKEHFIAHKLLAQENPEVLGLQQAFGQMCTCLKNTKRDYLLLAEEYARLREKIIRLSGKSVICIETGKLYNSIREAKLDFPTSGGGISRCCRNLAQTASGYHGAFTSDIEKIEELNILYKDKPQIAKECRQDRAIICIETQQIFTRVTEAINKFGMGVATCLAGKSKKAYGYHGVYLDDLKKQQKLINYIGKEPSFKAELPKRKVYCVELSRTFESLKEASIFAKVSSSAIMRCAQGKQKHAGGFTGQYI